MAAVGQTGAAQYLLRLDDLCPAGGLAMWHDFLPLFVRYGIQPILAVIPDNRDPQFEGGLADPGFWDTLRALEKGGAAIGLHGYQHLCQARGRSLIPMYRETEFAGAPEQWQRTWIKAGLAILREQGLNPRIWVAPRHGFDRTTLKILREEGMTVVSDGFAAKPFRSHEMTWIPQQMWAPVEKESGVWTICMHPNSLGEETEKIRELEHFLERYSGQFTSVDRLLSEWPVGDRSIPDRVFHWRMVAGIRSRQLRRKMMRR